MKSKFLWCIVWLLLCHNKKKKELKAFAVPPLPREEPSFWVTYSTSLSTATVLLVTAAEDGVVPPKVFVDEASAAAAPGGKVEAFD